MGYNMNYNGGIHDWNGKRDFQSFSRKMIVPSIISIIILCFLIKGGMCLWSVGLSQAWDIAMTDTNTGAISSVIPTLETKEVVDKIAPVETIYFPNWDSRQSKSETKYYLVAKDGTVCNVRMSVYLATKIESDYNGYWISK